MGFDYSADFDFGASHWRSLTTLLSIAQANVDTLLPLLINGGNKTVFAPTDAVGLLLVLSAPSRAELILVPLQAFAALPSNVTSNNTIVAQTVLYHIYYGSFPSAELTEGLTIARSALNATGVVNLRKRNNLALHELVS